MMTQTNPRTNFQTRYNNRHAGYEYAVSKYGIVRRLTLIEGCMWELVDTTILESVFSRAEVYHLPKLSAV